jgi:lipoyl(octanoyl) transferase
LWLVPDGFEERLVRRLPRNGTGYNDRMKGDRRRAVAWRFLGRVAYGAGVELQERLRDEVAAGRRGDLLLLLEHPHVYTLGRSARASDVLLPRADLERGGITVAECDRGGLATYHGPGQLVGYPILNLNPDRRDVRRYVRDLQAVLVSTLAAYGVRAEGRMKQPEIGVWAGDRKIASIGVHLSRWVTTHGFALNVTTDLSRFEGIVPCGMPEVRMTSIAAETGTKPTVEEVASVCATEFGRVFDASLADLAGV